MAASQQRVYSGPSLTLLYFDVAAKAEGIRLALAYSGLPFEDRRLSFAEFEAMKATGDFSFGQLPCLLVDGTTALVQTAAILRYVAKLGAGRTATCDLYPANFEQAAKVDAIMDQDTDMMTGFVSSQYSDRFGFGDVVASTGPLEKRARLGLVRRRLHDEVLPRHLDALCTLLQKSSAGWLAGTEGPTIADFMLVPTLQRLRGRSDGPPIGLGDGLSTGLIERRLPLVALIDRLMALPAVRAWYSSRNQQVTYSHLPRIGFGTFNNWSGSPDTNEDDALFNSVSCAIDAGYRHFDCAELYRNEDTIGNALDAAVKAGKVTREELFLVSKVWNNHRTTNAARTAVETTLKALRTDYLDLCLIHWPVCWTDESCPDMLVGSSIKVGTSDPRGEDVALEEAWKGMEALVDSGLVRQIGVSNYGVARLKRVFDKCRIRPVCNQVECHPHLAQKELLAYCGEQGVDLVAYHPIGKPNHRTEGDPVAIKEPVVISIAQRLGRTPSQVILAWNLKRGVVVIPKSCTPSRIHENFKAIEVDLTAEDMAAIDSLDRGSRFSKPPWMLGWH